MTDIHELFCANLKILREKRAYTQEKMAEKIGIGIRAYQRIEYGYQNGKYWPNPDRLRQLGKILKCDTIDFFKPVKKSLLK